MHKGILNASFDLHEKSLNAYQTGAGSYGVQGAFRGQWALHYQQIFTAIYQFLIGSSAQSLGITRVAYNKGLVSDSSTSHIDEINYAHAKTRGHVEMDYWDTELSSGNNAWAVFAFTSATHPFYVLIQFSGWNGLAEANLGNFGSAPGNPGMLISSFNQQLEGGVGIAVAMMQDGTSPWNGTTNNNGSDTKGSQVWKTNAILFPEKDTTFNGASQNDNATGKALFRLTMAEHHLPIHDYNPGHDAQAGVFSLIVSESSIIFLIDNFGNSNYSLFYFGKYTPINQSVNWRNYTCFYISNIVDSAVRVILPRYGDGIYSKFGNEKYLDNWSNDASITYIASPSFIGGGANNAHDNVTNVMIIDSNRLLSDPESETPIQLRHPNRAVSLHGGQKPGNFDMFNIPIACHNDMFSYDSRFSASNPKNTFGYGILGEVDEIKMVYGLPTNSTLNDRTYAVFGNTSLNTIKIAVPWDGITTPGIPGSRSGIVW